MSRAATAFLAFSLLALALPLAAPTASAYCVSSICTPVCVICPVILSQVVSTHCDAETDLATTTASCGSIMTGEHGASVPAPLPALAGAWVEVGPSGHLAYGYALP